MATHPLIVGGELTSEVANYGGDDTGPERYFIDQKYHFHHADRNSMANRRSMSSQSMSSISIDSVSVDEGAWSESSSRRFTKDESGGPNKNNRLRTIGEQRPASLSSVDFDQLNYHPNNDNGYISFEPTLGATTSSNNRPFSPHFPRGHPSTDSLIYSQSDRSGSSTPLASPKGAPDAVASLFDFGNFLMAPPKLKKTDRIPPRWRSAQKIKKSNKGGEEERETKETSSPVPSVVSLGSDEEDDIENKNTPMSPWDSTNDNLVNNVFRSTPTSTRNEENPLLKIQILADRFLDISCSILDSVGCSRSFDDEEGDGYKRYHGECRGNSFAKQPSLVSF